MKKNDEPIIVEETFHTSIDAVWKAITEPGQMRQWFFENIPDFKPEEGFETKFKVVSGERTFTHLWRVTEVIPKKKITYNWKYAEYTGDSFVTFELSARDDSVKLTLITIVTENFPDDVPEFKRESCIGGWEYFIKGNLRKFLSETV